MVCTHSTLRHFYCLAFLYASNTCNEMRTFFPSYRGRTRYLVWFSDSCWSTYTRSKGTQKLVRFLFSHRPLHTSDVSLVPTFSPNIFLCLLSPRALRNTKLIKEIVEKKDYIKYNPQLSLKSGQKTTLHHKRFGTETCCPAFILFSCMIVFLYSYLLIF